MKCKIFIHKEGFTVQFESLSEKASPITITQPEFMRRMKEMAMAGGGNPFMGDAPDAYSVAVNANHELVQSILKESDDAKKEDLAKQAYDIALLSQGLLTGEYLTMFVYRSVDLIK